MFRLKGADGVVGSSNCRATFVAVPVLPRLPAAVTWLPTKTVLIACAEVVGATQPFTPTVKDVVPAVAPAVVNTVDETVGSRTVELAALPLIVTWQV